MVELELFWLVLEQLEGVCESLVLAKSNPLDWRMRVRWLLVWNVYELHGPLRPNRILAFALQHLTMVASPWAESLVECCASDSTSYRDKNRHLESCSSSKTLGEDVAS